MFRMFNVNPATTMVCSKKDSDYVQIGNDIDGYFQVYTADENGIVLCDGLNKPGYCDDHNKKLANEVAMKAFNDKLTAYKASAKNKDNMLNLMTKDTNE